MTRREAIDMASQCLVELNKTPGTGRAKLSVEETIVTILIALGVLQVEDEQ
jgi:hypothetical protein